MENKIVRFKEHNFHVFFSVTFIFVIFDSLEILSWKKQLEYLATFALVTESVINHFWPYTVMVMSESLWSSWKQLKYFTIKNELWL